MVRVLLFAAGVLVAVSFLPVQSAQPSAFADPAFAARYQRAVGSKGLLWGSYPLAALVEPYTGAPGNRRLVQYFERGRMELERDAAGALHLTEGLLVREMATGYVQVGRDAFTQEAPAPLPLFAASADEKSPLTYADFAEAVSRRAPDRSSGEGDLLDDWIAPGGVFKQSPPVAAGIARYAAQTGHNIPDLFADWFDTRPFGRISVDEALGYPISEPYWTRSGLGSAGVSLVQLYERRALVYTPDLPAAERFSTTSAGRQYYRWRYGNDPEPSTGNASRSIVPAVDDDSGLSLPDGYRATVMLRDAADIVDIAVAPDGSLALAHAGGTITRLDPTEPRADPTPLVEHLANPVALAYAGTVLYVVDDAGLHRYQDIDTDGRIDAQQDILAVSLDRDTVAIAPGPEGSLYLRGERVEAGGRTSVPEPPFMTRVGPDGRVESLAGGVASPFGPLLVDDDGALWLLDGVGQLARVDSDGASLNAGATPGTLAPEASVVDLLLYRPDGTPGDPFIDMLALLVDPGREGGRIVRLQPARSVSNGPATAPQATPQPAAMVDFVGGLARPAAMASGLDGVLWVLDAGSNTLYRIARE